MPLEDLEFRGKQKGYGAREKAGEGRSEEMNFLWVANGGGQIEGGKRMRRRRRMKVKGEDERWKDVRFSFFLSFFFSLSEYQVPALEYPGD